MDAKVITRYIVIDLSISKSILSEQSCISPIPVDDETISSIILLLLLYILRIKTIQHLKKVNGQIKS